MLRPRHAVLTLAFCAGFSAMSVAAEGGAAALKAAQDKSAQSGKPLIVVCGAEWCGPCKTLEKWMQSDPVVKPVTDKFIYFHIDVDKQKEVYQTFTKKYPPPNGGGSIPMIFVLKSDGKLLDTMVGIKQQKGMADFFAKFAKETGPAGVALTPKTINLMKAAAKEAEALLDEGKFVSAYEKFADYAEELKSDNKALTKVKATIKKIEEAAIEKIGTAKEMVETANSEAKKLDGAYQLTVIAGSLEDLEAVAKKAESAISKLKEGKNADLFKQAKLLYSAREAAREEDNAKAKKLYEKLIADFKGTEAAKRAKTKLDELEGGS